MISQRLPTAQVMACGRTIAYTIRSSTRARAIGLWIRPETGLVVTIPPTATLRQAEAFILRHQRWALRHLDRFAALSARLPRRWPYGSTLPYRGEEHAVRLEDGRRSGVARTNARELVVSMRQPGLEGARRLLKRWYLGEASAVLTARTAALGQAMGVAWTRVTVRDPRSRWGSCSVQGRLSFSFRLVMAPPEVLNYVVAHELAHRVEPNHSPRFWAVVARHCPEYRSWLSWLRIFGPSLTL
ncbi:MAG: M48 family metallopeptidase [Candidatus Omnitrophica bacterium]|nr:M48 family metallopeptidase [Candidatus Omnitrophota bacterium]